MNRITILLYAAFLVPGESVFGEANVLPTKSSNKLLESKSITSKIKPITSEFYPIPGDWLREFSESGREFLLVIQDPNYLDVDLFLHDGIPGDDNRISEICSSQGTGRSESCRAFPSDISPEEDLLMIEVRGVDGTRSTKYVLTSAPFQGPRFEGTRFVGDDAKALKKPLVIEGTEEHEPILQLRTQLTERRPSDIYAIELPDPMSGPLAVDLVGTQPRGESEIKIFDGAGFQIAESFDRLFNSTATIPAEQQGNLVYVQVDSSGGDAFLYRHYIDVTMNFRLPSSVTVVRMDPEEPISFRSASNRSFSLIFVPGQAAFMSLHGCGNQLFLQEDLGDRVQLIIFNDDDSDTHAFFGQPAFGERTMNPDVGMMIPYAQETTITLAIAPEGPGETDTAAGDSRGSYVWQHSGSIERDNICEITGTVTDNTNYLMPFEPRAALNLILEGQNQTLTGTLLKDTGLVAYRVSRRQLNRSGATGITSSTEGNELDIAIVLENGFVQEVGSGYVQWQWDTEDSFAYIVLFRPPYRSHNEGDITYTLISKLIYGGERFDQKLRLKK
jgi:hypothetical protein